MSAVCQKQKRQIALRNLPFGEEIMIAIAQR